MYICRYATVILAFCLLWWRIEHRNRWRWIIVLEVIYTTLLIYARVIEALDISMLRLLGFGRAAVPY